MDHYTLLLNILTLFYSVSSDISIDLFPMLGVLDDFCAQKLNKYTTAMQNFTNCMLKESQALTACYSCGASYQIYSIQKNDLENDNRTNKKNQTCREQLRQHEFGLIGQVEYSTDELWKNVSCDKCYNRIGLDITIDPEYNQFRQLILNYDNCVMTTLPKSNKSTVCKECRPVYQKAVDYFHLSVDNKEMMQFIHCLDVKQVFYRIAVEWSSNFTCKEYLDDKIATYALTLVVLLLPIAFYVACWIQSDNQQVEYELVRNDSYYDEEEEELDRMSFVASSRLTQSHSGLFFSCNGESISQGSDVDAIDLHHGHSALGTGSITSSSPRVRLNSPGSSTNNLLL